MKKFLLSMAVGAMALSASAVPVFAMDGTGTTNIGYTDGAVTDPDNPTNPAWSVSVPKDFMFTKDVRTHDMTVTLNDIRDGGLAASDKVQIDVSSAQNYKLVNATAAADKIGSLDYELKYGAITNTDGKIGDLTQDAKTIPGTAVLEQTQLSNIGVDGNYKDILTYTIHGAVAK